MSNTLDFSTYQEKENKADAIWNSGVAGVVENVILTLRDNPSKTPDNNFPDYELIATDSQGRELVDAYWELAENATPEQMSKVVQQLGGLWKNIYGDASPLPNGKTVREILQLVTEGGLVRAFAAYGTAAYPKKYISLPRYRAFESMNVPLSESKIAVQANAIMQRPPRPEAETPKAPADSLPFS